MIKLDNILKPVPEAEILAYLAKHLEIIQNKQEINNKKITKINKKLK